MQLGPYRALVRAGISLAVGGAVALAVGAAQPSRVLAALGGWDAGGIVLLLLAWHLILGSDAASTQRLAAADDPGRTAVYALVVASSAVSLLSSTALVRQAKRVPGPHGDALVLLCLATVALSWALTHTAFALRYAHLYYRADAEGVGGLELPGGQRPAYFDFAYFALTIGMCFQVSDVMVTSPQIRRSVLLHAVLSFGYNTAILAFVLNLLFGLAA